MNGLIQFRNKTLDITLEEAIKACKESVEYAILVEKSLHLEGERTIGGDIQWVVLDYDKVKE